MRFLDRLRLKVLIKFQDCPFALFNENKRHHMEDRKNTRELQPADLRGILKYVPLWRNHVFVIALDGAVMDEDNFGNIMLALAVLRNLNIRVVLIYGIGAQIQQLATERGIAVSDVHGYGPTDEKTLKIGMEASGILGQQIQSKLTQNSLRCAIANAVRCTELGIIGGVSQLNTGKVEKVDTELIESLLHLEIVPIISPIGYSRDGQPLRINSDLLASELARELKASKLIFLLPHAGLTIKGQFRLNADVNEVRQWLEKDPQSIDECVRSKARYAIKTIDAGTPRAHIIDSRIHDGLLLEVFSKVGIGSMIHSNPYTQIRPARKKDVSAIYSLTKSAVRDESLRPRTRQNIESAIADYHVYEIDESIIGCFRLSSFPRSATVELGSVFVHPAYHGRHIGQTLVEYAIELGRKSAKRKIIALTTQSLAFFRNSCGFKIGTPADLPASLHKMHTSSTRKSHVLVREIKS